MKYLPTCPSCHIYPRQSSTDEKSLCYRCEEKARLLKRQLEAEARTAPQEKPPEPDQANQGEQVSMVGYIENRHSGYTSVRKHPSGEVIREWTAIPCCSRCMTTQDVKYVDPETNTGICQRCLRKRHHGPSWGMTGLTPKADINAIY